MMLNIKALWEKDWFKVGTSLLAGAAIGVVFMPSKASTEKEKTQIKESYELQIAELNKTHREEQYKLANEKSATEQRYAEQQSQLSKKIEVLAQENRSLKTSVKKKKFKMVKPDGTIIEREVEESNSEELASLSSSIKEEFEQKVKQIESNWKSVHEKRVVELKKQFDQDLSKAKSEQKIVEKIVEKEKVVVVNKKSLRTEIGGSYNKDKDVNGYFHGSYPVAGPIFIGGGASGSNKGWGDIRLGAGISF